ncbi:MAG: hypothetical protein HFF43_02555 [Lawsonibacter sp.]|jgi:hypothetical protein|nr:hypothetical protein [Lawsonibacter sp.]
MASWQDYLKLLRNLSKTLGQLTQVERDKNAAAAAGDLAGVEECMKREQVLSLSLRGYDQKRDAMLAALGLKGVTLRELANHSPEELRLEVKGVAEELRRQYEIFQSASKAARNTLELNLRAIERVQAVRAGDAAQAEEQRKNHQTDFRA